MLPWPSHIFDPFVRPRDSFFLQGLENWAIGFLPMCSIENQRDMIFETVLEIVIDNGNRRGSYRYQVLSSANCWNRIRWTQIRTIRIESASVWMGEEGNILCRQLEWRRHKKHWIPWTIWHEPCCRIDKVVERSVELRWFPFRILRDGEKNEMAAGGRSLSNGVSELKFSCRTRKACLIIDDAVV